MKICRCPENPERCSLGVVSDICGCCPEGVCAKMTGEACWNSSISQLPFEKRNEGLCAENYSCQLRLDLQPEVYSADKVNHLLIKIPRG